MGRAICLDLGWRPLSTMKACQSPTIERIFGTAKGVFGMTSHGKRRIQKNVHVPWISRHESE